MLQLRFTRQEMHQISGQESQSKVLHALELHVVDWKSLCLAKHWGIFPVRYRGWPKLIGTATGQSKTWIKTFDGALRRNTTDLGWSVKAKLAAPSNSWSRYISSASPSCDNSKCSSHRLKQYTDVSGGIVSPVLGLPLCMSPTSESVRILAVYCRIC